MTTGHEGGAEEARGKGSHTEAPLAAGARLDIVTNTVKQDLSPFTSKKAENRCFHHLQANWKQGKNLPLQPYRVLQYFVISCVYSEISLYIINIYKQYILYINICIYF